MNPLNPFLFDHLKACFGYSRVSNDGQAAQITYLPDWFHRGGRLKAHVSCWGEVYHVDCPFCNDTRQRLYFCHLWASVDPQTFDDMIHLVKCHNDDCLARREDQKKLHAMVFPRGCWAAEMTVPEISAKPAAAPIPVKIVLPVCMLLDKLPANHPAREYVRGRGFDPDVLAHVYGVAYCERDSNSAPRISTPRVIIPIFVRDPLATASGGPGVRLASWQGRAIRGDLPAGCPKYLTATGSQKSLLLYGLPLALKENAPPVLVEGVTDSWKVGTNALAMLGKTLSVAQCALIVSHFPGRPVVILLDADAQAAAQKVRDAIRSARLAAGDRSPVLLGHLPEGRADPGSATTAELTTAIADALRKSGSEPPAPRLVGAAVAKCGSGLPC